MSCLVKDKTLYDLTRFDRQKLIEKFRETLRGRVEAAYLFGSFAKGTVDSESDIDLILIQETDKPFTQRGMDFGDLFEIYPNLDLLVYTQAEFDRARLEPQGFWLSVKNSLLKIV